MIATGSELIVVVLGISVCVLAAWGIYTPARLVKLVSGVMDQGSGIYIAVIVRLLLGVALIIVAPDSRFPAAFQVLGLVAIFAAAVVAFMGRNRVRRLVGWFERFSPAVVRLWLLFGMAFGGVLIYGVF